MTFGTQQEAYLHFSPPQLPRSFTSVVCLYGCEVGAGTGKSLLLKHILRALPQATTYVTASTGLAASVLGGTTLNAFAGMC